MQPHNINLAERYYINIKEKNTTQSAALLHPNITFSAPLAKIAGKDTVLDAIQKFAAFIEDLTVRAVCGSDDHVMIAYNVQFPAPIGNVPSAALMTFKDGLIAGIELFYDARPFEKK